MRTTRSLAPVRWVKELRDIAASTHAQHLHYARLGVGRRLAVCEHLAQKPFRAFCVASNKTNLRQYSNQKLGQFSKGDKFYNWCVRLLFERITAWAEDWYRQEELAPAPLEIVFARRGGHGYRHMFAYFDLLRMQVANGTLVLKSGGLAPPSLERTHWRVAPAESVAGCQIADVIVSAVYQGVNSASPNWDMQPALSLEPIFAKGDDQLAANVGLTAWPLVHQAEIPEDSRPLFEAFGYQF